MRRFLLLSCLSVQCVLLAASENYRIYDVRSGLSENSVLDIFQDEHGYMWMATKDGLNRFNGYTFDVFRKNINGVNLKIDALLPHEDGRRIWVGSDSKLLLFDPYEESFYLDPVLEGITGVQSLCHDGESLWIAAGTGVFRWDGTGNPIKYDIEDASDEVVARAVVKDSDGHVLVGMGGAVYRYIPESDDFIRYALPSGNEVTAMYDSGDGKLLVGTYSGEVYSFSLNNGRTFKVLACVDSRIHDFQKETGTSNLLIGSDSGLYVYDEEDRTISRTEGVLGRESIYRFCIDREGALWVGTYFCGVFYKQPNHKDIKWYYDNGVSGSLKGNAVSDICEDKSGNLWVATENGGLNYIDVASHRVKDYTDKSFGNIHALCLDGDDLYIGTFSKGMDVLNIRTGQTRRYVNNQNDPHSLVNDFVYSIFKSSKGIIYIGTLKGVCTFNPTTGKFAAIKELSESFICDIKEDNEGNIWCAEKNDGVYCLSSQTGQWRSWRYPDIPSNRICGIFVDRDSTVWLCTNGAGICKYDSQDDRFISVKFGTDIPGVCYQMLQDHAGYYWVSSNSGLFRFSQTADRVVFYTVEDGLQSDQFNYNSALKASDGRLWFGGVNGLNSIDPLNLMENTVRPNVRIASVTTASEETFGEAENLLIVDGKVRTPHDISSIDITFDVLSNIAPGKNQVAYMIEEISETWEISPQRALTLMNPSPGTYTLRVKGCNNDGYWSAEDAILKIEVLPHPLRSLPAIIVYVVIACGLAVLIYMLMDRNFKRRKEEELRALELENEKASIQSKMNFFTNVAHEIKTPVTLISAPLDKIIETGEWNDEVESNLRVMKKNSDRLLNLVKQLLDFRKIEKDSFKLTLAPADINLIVTETIERFELIRPEITFKIQLAADDTVVNVDSEALVKVLSNLLTNAVKYTSDEIVVKVVKTQSQSSCCIQLRVADNGPGVPVELRDKIFDMFYQVHPGKVNGFGVGLSLVKHLVELHCGRVYVDSGYEEGCEMVVEIPYGLTAAHDAKMVESESSKACVLVVEDTKDMQEFLVNNIGTEFLVLAADNGSHALKMLDENNVDIILSDLYMPEMDGLELLKQVRNNQHVSHIPFILLTAQDSMATKIASLEYGADAYIEKPFSLEHVRATINNLISRRNRIHRSVQTSLEIDVDKERIAGPDAEWLSKVNSLILKNLSNDTYCIDDLAGDMSVSRTLLQRKLKALTGSTPNDYIRLIRLKKAAELLSHEGYRVSEVCYLVGFNSPSYFTKCFVKQFGIKPKNFQTSRTDDK